MIGADQAMRPAVAAAESCSPTSTALAGLATIRRATAQPSAAAAVPGRPDSRASSATPVIAAARTTDGDAPARTAYTAIATTIAPERVRRARPASTAPDQPGDEGDVPARDRDDVREPGRRERRGEVAVDPVAEPDKDPGGEARRRLGERTRERVARGSPNPLQHSGRVTGVSHELQRAGPQRAGDPGSPQEVPVRRPLVAPPPSQQGAQDRRAPPPGIGAPSPRASPRTVRSV